MVLILKGTPLIIVVQAEVAFLNQLIEAHLRIIGALMKEDFLQVLSYTKI